MTLVIRSEGTTRVVPGPPSTAAMLALIDAVEPTHRIVRTVDESETATANRINAQIAEGPGVVELAPDAVYMVDAPIVFADDVRLVGGGGGKQTASTRLIYTGTGDRFLDMREVEKAGIADISIEYESSSFAGVLVDTTATQLSNSSLLAFERVNFGSSSPSSVRTAASLLKLYGTVVVQLKGCRFSGSTYHVEGPGAGAGGDLFSNIVTFDGCFFNQYTSWITRNPGRDWVYTGCSFEPNTGGIVRVALVESGKEAHGLSFFGCDTGDNTANGSMIRFRGKSLGIFGGRWTPRGGTIVEAMEAVAGVHVIGPDCETTFSAGSVVDFSTNAGADASTHVVVMPGEMGSMSSAFEGNVYPDGSLYVGSNFARLSGDAHTFEGFRLGTGGGPKFAATTNAEGVLTAPVGSHNARTDGHPQFKRTGTGNTGWVPYAMVQNRTAAALGNVVSDINTTGKTKGLMVYDDTNNRPLWAAGSAAADVWRLYDGTTAITPA